MLQYMEVARRLDSVKEPVLTDSTRTLSNTPQKQSAAPYDASSLVLLPDEKLIEAFRKGHREAFDTLYLRYQPRILSFLRGMIANHAVAEDVFNDVMYRVYVRLPDGIEPGMFRRYVFKAAYNACLNAQRRERRLSRQALEATSEEGWDGAAGQATPEETLSNHQLCVLARRFLERLPEDRRSVLLLYHNEGLTYQEIAAVLGKPIGTVRWLIHEARVAMAKHLRTHLTS